MAASLEALFGGEAPGEPDEPAGELRRALVVAAHPDDADFGAAGTAALLVRAGPRRSLPRRPIRTYPPAPEEGRTM